MFRRVARASEIPQGRGLRVRVDGVEIALFRRGGEVAALEGLCPHAGVPLGDGDVEGGQVICPGHGWEFDLRTGEGPFGERVALFPVKLDGDDVWLDPDSPYES